MEFENWELESAVAKKLGVSRDVLIEYRKAHLEKNQDWRTDRKQVELSPAAIEKISTVLGAPVISPPALPGNPSPAHMVPAAEPEVPVELEVLKLYPNPRLLAAKTPAGELVLVAVPKNRNFRPRMRIKATPPDNANSSLYHLEGRCPRFPGRW